MIVECRGRWERHATHGQQLVAETIAERMPVDPEAIAAYLVHADLPAVGRITAKRIVEAFGDDTFRVIEEEPERLTAAKVPARQIRPLHDAWLARLGAHRVMLYLQSHGVPPAMSTKISAHLSLSGVPLARQVATIAADPFLISYVSGVGFLTADALASRLGVAAAAPSRLAAGAAHVLRQRAENAGHIYCRLDELDALAAELLGVEHGCVARVVRATADGPGAAVVVFDEPPQPIVAPRALCIAELRVGFELRRVAGRGRGLVDATHPLLRGPFTVDAAGQRLNDDQAEAVVRACTSPLSVVTGGPGTGKTATMRAILGVVRSLGMTATCCAPTGLAALRLADSTGEEAATIHSTIGLGTLDGAYPIESDILIVDEVSMLGVMLAATFASEIHAKAVVLVGDANQLPSVEPGNVLRDLIDSGACPVTRLATVYRQGVGSRGGGIVDACHAIINGRMPELAPDFSLHELGEDEDDERTAELIGERFVERLRAGAALTDVMILSPMRSRGPVAVEPLNRRIQQLVNPARDGVREILLHGGVLREGDRVMQLRNDVQARGLVNGDIGVVVEIDPQTPRVFVAFGGGRGIEMDREAAQQLVLAYAITIHKSQGSEFRHVIAPMTYGHYAMLTRNLLYTLVSRARESCSLVGTKRAMRHAIRKEANALRETRLTNYLTPANGL